MLLILGEFREGGATHQAANAASTPAPTRESVRDALIRRQDTSKSALIPAEVRFRYVLYLYLIPLVSLLFCPIAQFQPAPQQPVQYYPPTTHYTQPPLVANAGPFLKECSATGCSSRVHYDAELGPFDYCSPECRDRHLLPQEREKLRRDIDENRTKMVTFQPSPPATSRASSSASYSPSGKPSTSVTKETTTADGKKSTEL